MQVHAAEEAHGTVPRTTVPRAGTRLRPAQRIALVAPALVCAATVGAALLPGLGTVTHLEPTSWNLVSVDGRYLTILIRSVEGGCGRVADVRLFQTADTVTIAAFRRVGDDLCGHGDGSACRQVKLHRPIGDRRLVHDRISRAIGPEREDLALTSGLVANPYAGRCADTDVVPAAVRPLADRVGVAGSTGTRYS